MKTEPLQNFIKSKYFKNYYFVAMMMKQGIPEIAQIEKKHKEFPDNKVVTEAWTILKDVKPDELKAINE